MRRLIITVYCSSGIWLLRYTLPLLSVSRDLPAPLMWAWSSLAELIFFNAAPLLFVGIDITFIYYTTMAQIACDWMSAGLYLAAGFFAWKRGREGFEESHPH